MSRLLSRLAAQAFGVAPALRSTAALPFAGARFDPGPSGETPTVPATATWSGEQPITSQPLPDEAALLKTATRFVESMRHGLAPPIEPRSPVGGGGPREVESDRDPKTITLRAPTASWRIDFPPALVRANAPLHPEVAIESTTFQSREQGASPEPPPQSQTSGSPLMPATREPPPVMPSRYAPERRVPAPFDAAHEPFEVHVYIGRVELTAVQEAPPPKVRRRAAPGPMSLEDYLARRERRA